MCLRLQLAGFLVTGLNLLWDLNVVQPPPRGPRVLRHDAVTLLNSCCQGWLPILATPASLYAHAYAVPSLHQKSQGVLATQLLCYSPLVQLDFNHKAEDRYMAQRCVQGSVIPVFWCQSG